MERVLVIHGPNLNMLGKRNISHYGNKDLDEVNNILKDRANKLCLKIDLVQSNIEGEIVSNLHLAEAQYDGVIINPGAYTHYSLAIRDAIEILSIPVIEVHLSNIYSREEFRSKSVIAPVCRGQVSGLGYISYLAALDALKDLFREECSEY